MSIRASLHEGNARHPVGPIFLAFLRNRASRGQLLFSIAKVAAPVALVAGLVVVGAAQRGPSPIAALAEPGAWRAVAAEVIPVAVAAADAAPDSGPAPAEVASPLP